MEIDGTNRDPSGEYRKPTVIKMIDAVQCSIPDEATVLTDIKSHLRSWKAEALTPPLFGVVRRFGDTWPRGRDLLNAKIRLLEQVRSDYSAKKSAMTNSSNSSLAFYSSIPKDDFYYNSNGDRIHSSTAFVSQVSNNNSGDLLRGRSQSPNSNNSIPDRKRSRSPGDGQFRRGEPVYGASPRVQNFCAAFQGPPYGAERGKCNKPAGTCIWKHEIAPAGWKPPDNYINRSQSPSGSSPARNARPGTPLN